MSKLLSARHLGRILLSALVASSCACTVLLEERIEKCKLDSDCAALGAGFASAVCDTERGLCINSTQKTTGGCSSNAECIVKNNGQAAVCRKTDFKCIPVLSTECTQIRADGDDLSNDDAILIGTILARSGVTAPAAAAMEDAMDLARRDFRTATPGLPPAVPGGRQRPLVLVHCDETDDPLKAANHLADLGVPAIIGAYYSSSTIKIATTVTIPKNVLLVSPASNSPLITTLPSSAPRMVWRTVPSDVIQASVVPQVVSTILEPAIRAKLGATATLKVAIVHRGDAAGVGISTAVAPKLIFNGLPALANGDNFKPVDYGDPLDKTGNPDPTVKYAEAAARLLEFQPHIVIGVGVTTELITSIRSPREQRWTATTHRPHYLLANNTLQSQDTLNFIGTNADLRHRVLGHIAGASGQAIEALRFRFVSNYTSSHTGLVPFAYDAVYLIALGIVASGNQPLTGTSVAGGLE